jgi:hypothetical protein
MQRHPGVSSNNRAAFRAVFRRFVLLCRRLDLYDRELLAVDGTRIRQKNKDSNFTRSSLREFIPDADQRPNNYLQRLDRSNAANGTTGGEARTKNLKNRNSAREVRLLYEAMPAQLEHGRACEGRRRLQCSDRGRRNNRLIVVEDRPSGSARRQPS